VNNCACGCGRLVAKTWAKGHHNCGKRGQPFTEERRAKIRAARALQAPNGLTKATAPGFAALSTARSGVGNPQFGLRGEAASNWKGGGWTDRRGYQYQRIPSHPLAQNGYVREHVLIAEREAGRPLTRADVVHHVDTDPANNNPDNLVVTTSSGHRHMHLSLATATRLALKRGLIRLNRETWEYEVP
jgi:hypothetical protein